MWTSRTIAIVVAALIAMSLIGVTAAYAFFIAKDSGSGPTLAAAEQNAKMNIIADYGPCEDFDYYAYGQLANGTWWADVEAECSSYH
jgi:hypothetical protein